MKKRKVNLFRLSIVVLIIVVILGLSFFAIKKIYNILFVDSSNSSIQTNEIIEGEYSYKIVSYNVYKPENLGFNFVVASINLTGDLLNANLKDFITSENVVLDQNDYYIEKLKSNNYDISTLLISETISSKSNQQTFNFFIPFTSDTLFIKKDDIIEYIKLDNKDNIKDITKLKTETSNEIVANDNKFEDENYSITVEESYITDQNDILKNGNYEDAIFPTTVRIYTFRIKCENVKSDIKIIDAKFITSNGTTESALDSSFSTTTSKNIMSSSLKDIKEGVLMFVFFNPEDDIDYNGKLQIQLSNSSTWLTLNTKLK